MTTNECAYHHPIDPDPSLVCVHFIGDDGSGKDSLVERFINECYHSEKESKSDPQQFDRLTLDKIAYKEKLMHVDDSLVKVRLWNYRPETPENPRYLPKVVRCMMASGAAIVFDLTNRESYERLAEHVKFIREALSPEKARYYPIAIVGNKLDLVLADPNSRRTT